MLHKKYSLAKIGVDTAENGPRKGLKGYPSEVPDGDTVTCELRAVTPTVLIDTRKPHPALLSCRDLRLSDRKPTPMVEDMAETRRVGRSLYASS